MKLIQVADIVVRSRQRKAMNPAALTELKASIVQRGLLHAPVVRFENGITPVLVAGERRLTAIKELAKEGVGFTFDRELLPPGICPVMELEDRGEIANREVELEENIRREDLSWQDKVAAINELHTLRLAQNPGQTKTRTGEELAAATNREVNTTRLLVDRATIIAGHLDDPDVQRASSENEAFRIVSRKLESQFTAALAAQTPSRPSEHVLIQGDMRSELVLPWKERFACAIFDPPYGMGADTFGDAAVLAHQYEDTPEAARELMKYFFQFSPTFMAEQSHVYVFCDIEQFEWLREIATSFDFKPLRTPLIWTKGSQGHVPDQAVGWRRTYECIMFAARGRKPLTHVQNDVLTVAPEATKLHAAQKPVELYRQLLALSCLPGDRVLDPCCGAGTIFKAAHALRLRATGIELNEQYAGFARSAIAGLQPLTDASSATPAQTLDTL